MMQKSISVNHTLQRAGAGLALSMIVLLAAGAMPAYAANFTVDGGGDGSDANPGDGQCETSNNNCTLRAAIEEANASAGPDTVTFNIGTDTLNPATPYPALTDDGTTIRGGGDITLDGSAPGSSSGLHILGASNCVIQGLIITNFGADGIRIEGGRRQAAQNNLIGTDGDGNNDGQERNVINNSGGYGISLNGVSNGGVLNNVIAGNRIGTNQGGGSAAPNANAGIMLMEAHGNRIGTSGDRQNDDNERNLISGNGGAGIQLDDADDNVIAGNFIGTTDNGSGAMGNGSSGIEMFNGSSGNRIGTDGNGMGDSAERNVISGNGGNGLLLDSAGGITYYNVIAGNYIGTSDNGSQALPNDNGIVMVGNVAGNIVGTNSDGQGDDTEGNVISGNTGTGILLDWSSNNVITGNIIGLDAAGASALGNATGISVEGFENRIGTIQDYVSDAEERNVISGNTGTGIVMHGMASGTHVSGNYIGTDAAGTAAVGNGGGGVAVTTGASGNVIGTYGFGGVHHVLERNVISGNGIFGVRISDSSNNVVAGNFIGTAITGEPLGNDGAGVEIIAGSSLNTVGGNLASEGNMISDNSGSGVEVSSSSVSNPILSNAILDNWGLSIDLNANGVADANDSGDGDGGGNQTMNHPEVLAATLAGNTMTITAQIDNGLPNASFTIQYYANFIGCNTSGRPIHLLLGTFTHTTNASGDANFIDVVTYNGPTSMTIIVAATATNDGNTSEVSLCKVVSVR
jgi:CSLREA domain-containing protein